MIRIARHKVGHLRIALGMASIGINDQTSELILQVQHSMEVLGGDFSLMDASRLEAEVLDKYTRLSKMKGSKRKGRLYKPSMLR